MRLARPPGGQKTRKSSRADFQGLEVPGKVRPPSGRDDSLPVENAELFLHGLQERLKPNAVGRAGDAGPDISDHVRARIRRRCTRLPAVRKRRTITSTPHSDRAGMQTPPGP